MNAPTAAERLRIGGSGRTGNEREPRRAVELDGFLALDNGATFPVRVRDLSYDGCKIETPVTLNRDVRLQISVTGIGGALWATVRWCLDGEVGLRFDAPDAQQQSTSHIPRVAERTDVSGDISLRRFGRSHYQARLFNLAPNGCKVEFVERPKAGDIVWVKLDGLEAIEGVVRWVDGFYGGLQFVRPIYPAVFQLLVAKLRR